MISTRFYLDIRGTAGNGKAPLKICITKHGRSAYIPLNVRLTPEQWNARAQKANNIPNKAAINSYINNKKMEVDNLIMKLSANGEITAFTAIQIKDRLLDLLDPETENRDCLIPRFKKYAEQCKAKRTREIYEATISAILEYDKKANTMSFDSIKKDWVNGFVLHLTKKGLQKNSRNIHLRNLRAVINDAIDNDITSNYPLRKIDMTPEQTKKRSLDIKDLRKFFNIKHDEWQEKYLDYFKLTFFLIGINPADLLTAQKAQYTNGRLIYKRAKTGRWYNIKVEPEAQELIAKYAGQTKLVNFAEGFKAYKTFVGKMDKGLKSLGTKIYYPNPEYTEGSQKKRIRLKRIPMVPDISIYWARHTWSTIAYNIGIPEEVISDALGHSFGNRTTNIYIDKRNSPIDEANRRVIDYVLYKRTRK